VTAQTCRLKSGLDIDDLEEVPLKSTVSDFTALYVQYSYMIGLIRREGMGGFRRVAE
jgi:hypothetical protein